MTFMTKMHGCKLLTKTVCKYTYEKNVIVKSRVLLLVVNTTCLGGLKKGVQHNDSVSTHVVIITKSVKVWKNGISKEWFFFFVRLRKADSIYIPAQLSGGFKLNSYTVGLFVLYSYWYWHAYCEITAANQNWNPLCGGFVVYVHVAACCFSSLIFLFFISTVLITETHLPQF